MGALESAMRGDYLDRRLTEELRMEEALRMDAAAAAGMPPTMAPPMPYGSPGGLARARLEVERLSGELSREAVTGVSTYLRAGAPQCKVCGRRSRQTSHGMCATTVLRQSQGALASCAASVWNCEHTL